MGLRKAMNGKEEGNRQAEGSIAYAAHYARFPALYDSERSLILTAERRPSFASTHGNKHPPPCPQVPCSQHPLHSGRSTEITHAPPPARRAWAFQRLPAASSASLALVLSAHLLQPLSAAKGRTTERPLSPVASQCTCLTFTWSLSFL